MLEVIKIERDTEYMSSGCSCCEPYGCDYYILPTGERYTSAEDALLQLLHQRGIVVEFD